MRAWIWTACLAWLGGCSGEYILTVGDQLAPLGGQAMIVCRLQRREVLPLAVKDAAMLYVATNGTERAAYSDASGYAGAAVPVGQTTGQFPLIVSHQDSRGEEVRREVRLYVWAPEAPVVAVDLHAVLDSPPGGPEEARVALLRLAAKANILYMTSREVPEHPAIHQALRARGYPDGPVLAWRRQYWHAQKKGAVTYVVVQTRLVSQLEQLTRMFPRLTGLAGSQEAAQAFSNAGLSHVLIAPGQAVQSWSGLTAQIESGQYDPTLSGQAGR